MKSILLILLSIYNLNIFSQSYKNEAKCEEITEIYFTKKKYKLIKNIRAKIYAEHCKCDLCTSNSEQKNDSTSHNSEIQLSNFWKCLDTNIVFVSWFDNVKNDEKCLLFNSYILYNNLPNAIFVVLDPTNIMSFDTSGFKNKFFLGLQVGYYFRNEFFKTQTKFRSIHPSYSLNIKHGVTISYTEATSKRISPFLGVDFSLNGYIQPIRGLISYSFGYSVIQPENANHWYSSFGVSFIIF